MLQVTLLGEQALSDATGTVRVRSSRTLELVAFLVIHAGRPQTRQRIAALFWPDSTDEQALTNLRRELHHLRGVLDGGSSLVVTSRDLSWHDTPDCEVDVRVFAAHRTAALAAAARGDTTGLLDHAGVALDRYRGEFLPGSYDDWALEARTELEQQCVDLLDRSVEARAGSGDLAGAVDVARRRVQVRPLEESGYRRLMELQGDLGDRAGAVSTYHHCASVLERELGVEPDPLTRTTLNRLLARAGPAAAPARAARPGSARAGRAGAELVGRVEEFGLLHERWRSAAGGRPGLVLVRGAAGVGKSRLVAELAGAVQRSGAVVARAECFGTAGRLALAPVADWLRTPAIRAALAGLAPVWRTEAERLVPAARTRPEPGPGPVAMVDAWQRHRFFEGVTRALISPGRPVLLTLDNLHWCDPETLAFLTFCLRLTTDAPIMVAATMRDSPEDHEPELARWIVQMRATGLLTELPLQPFDVADTAALAEAITGQAADDEAAAMLQAATGGFPLYIVESARAGRSPGPRSVPASRLAAVLVDRLGQMSPTARDVASLGAAVGRDFTLDLLTEAADLDADTVVGAVDELWRGRILRETGDGYDFSHDLLRESAYGQVSPPKRWLLHRRVAQGLELLHAADPDAVSAQLAEQYARGGRGERAVDYYRRAADVAAGMFAHGEAIRLLEEALSIVRALPEGRDRTRRELELLEAMAAPLNARFGYSSPRLRETLETAIARAETLGRRDSVLNALVGLWASQFVHGDTAAAHRTAGRALALVEPGSGLSGPAHFAFGGSALSLGRPAEALEHLALAADFGGTHPLSVGTRPDVHGQAFAAHAYWLLGDADAALASCTRSIALARTTDNPYVLAVALAYGAITHQLRDDASELVRVVEELRRLCDRYSFAYYGDWGLVLDGWTRRNGAGIDMVKAAIANLDAHGSFARMPYWLSLLADLMACTGEPGAASATLDAALAAGQAHDDVWWLPEVMRMRAAYDGEERAVERLRAASRMAAGHGSVELLARCVADLEERGVPAGAFAVRPAP